MGDLVMGYLFIARADGERYNAQDRALLEGIAAHAGSAFVVSRCSRASGTTTPRR